MALLAALLRVVLGAEDAERHGRDPLSWTNMVEKSCTFAADGFSAAGAEARERNTDTALDDEESAELDEEVG